MDHSGALAVMGFKRKAKLYLLGNPLGSTNITKIDLRGALYAPLRLLVYEDVQEISHALYDLPSSQFGQLGNAEIDKFSVTLDAKMDALVKMANVPNS